LRRPKLSTKKKKKKEEKEEEEEEEKNEEKKKNEEKEKKNLGSWSDTEPGEPRKTYRQTKNAITVCGVATKTEPLISLHKFLK
jgi:hypothetical protein